MQSKPIATQEEIDDAVKLWESPHISLMNDMKQKAMDRAYKGSWENSSIHYALNCLIAEIEELEEAIRYESSRDIQLECADIANYATIIHSLSKNYIKQRRYKVVQDVVSKEKVQIKQS